MFIHIYGPHAYDLPISNVETRLKWLLTAIILKKKLKHRRHYIMHNLQRNEGYRKIIIGCLQCYIHLKLNSQW